MKSQWAQNWLFYREEGCSSTNTINACSQTRIICTDISSVWQRVLKQLKAMRGPEAPHIESESDNSEGNLILKHRFFPTLITSINSFCCKKKKHSKT